MKVVEDQTQRGDKLVQLLALTTDQLQLQNQAQNVATNHDYWSETKSLLFVRESNSDLSRVMLAIDKRES